MTRLIGHKFSLLERSRVRKSFSAASRRMALIGAVALLPASFFGAASAAPLPLPQNMIVMEQREEVRLGLDWRWCVRKLVEAIVIDEIGRQLDNPDNWKREELERRLHTLLDRLNDWFGPEVDELLDEMQRMLEGLVQD